MEVSSQIYYPAALLPGKSPRFPLDMMLGGIQSRCRRGGEEKISQPLPRLEHPIIQPVSQHYTTELTRLLNIHSYISIKKKAFKEDTCLIYNKNFFNFALSFS
jgi:hypothetical protein